MLHKKPNVNHTDRPRPERKLLDRARQIMRRDCDNSNSGQSFAEEVMQEPYEYCGRMREEDPLHWNELYELWLITRYDDLVWLTRHPELFSVGLLAARPAGAVSVRQ